MFDNEKMDIFTSANFFIHHLDVDEVIVRALSEKRDCGWIVNLGNNVSLWFDNKDGLIAFADRILSIVKVIEIEEKVNNETNS